MLRRLNRLVIAHPRAVIAVVLTVTLLALPLAGSLEFATDVEEFLPESQVVKDDRRVQELFGNTSKLAFVYITPNVPYNNTLTLPALREAYNISQQIQQTSTELGIINTISVAQLFNNALQDKLNIDIFNESVNWTTIYEVLLLDQPEDITIDDVRYLIRILINRQAGVLNSFIHGEDPQADSTLIIVELDSNLTVSERKEYTNDLREVINQQNKKSQYVHGEVASVDLLAYDVDKKTSQTNLLIGIGMFVVSVIVLSWAFRSVSYILLPLFTLALALIWTFAMMAALDIAFTAIHVAVLPLIMGLGIDYTVHICRRYQEELSQNRSVRQALLASTDHVGHAIFLTAATTSVAFLSNITAGVSPVRNFGLLAAMGITFAFLLSLTFHTALRYLIDTGQFRLGGWELSTLQKPPHSTPLLDRSLALACAKVERYPVQIIAVVAIVSIASFWGATKVDSQFALDDFLSDKLDVMVTSSQIQEDFLGASYSQSYILVEGDVTTPQFLLDVGQLYTTNLANDELVLREDGIPRATSVLTIARQAQQQAEEQPLMAENGYPTEQERRVLSPFIAVGKSTNLYLKWQTNREEAYNFKVTWYDGLGRQLSSAEIVNETEGPQARGLHTYSLPVPKNTHTLQAVFTYWWQTLPTGSFVDWLEVYNESDEDLLIYSDDLSRTFKLDSQMLPLPETTSKEITGLYLYLYSRPEQVDYFSNQTIGQAMVQHLHQRSPTETEVYDASLVRVFIGKTDKKAEDEGWTPSNLELEQLHDELKEDVQGLFTDQEVSITGGYILTIVTINALQQSQINSTLIAVILAFLLLILLYRNLGLGFIAIFPLLLVMVWVLATMALMDITLNVMTVMVTALTIGLGIDYAIHIIERYREERSHHTNLESIEETIQHTGSALIISAVTTIAGFGVLILSPMPLVRDFGIITAATIFYALMVAVVILPIFLLLAARWKVAEEEPRAPEETPPPSPKGVLPDKTQKGAKS